MEISFRMIIEVGVEKKVFFFFFTFSRLLWTSRKVFCARIIWHHGVAVGTYLELYQTVTLSVKQKCQAKVLKTVKLKAVN